MAARRFKSVRMSLVAAAATIALAASAGHALAQAPAAVHQYNIPAQSLSSALLELSRQSDVLIVVSPDLTRGKRSAPLHASLPVYQAIAELLRGTDLHAIQNEKGGYSIERAEGASSATASEKGAATVAEVVVTASKRSQRLLDAPVPVTALQSDTLSARNETRLQDYFRQVPGLSLNAAGDGTTNIVIRGVNTGVFGNPTVGVLINDIPFGASTAISGGQILQPDLDPADLSQIEVLRGPQGTLYGASTLGGLINYETKDPSTTRYNGHIQGDVNSVDGGGIGYGVSGSVNVPISDTLAVRASAFDRKTAGYIDNVYTGRNNINQIYSNGAEFSLLWTPAPIVTVKLGMLYQGTHSDASPAINTNYYDQPTYGQDKLSLLSGSGGYRSQSELYSANIVFHLGWGDLTSLTGYGVNQYKEASDTSLEFASAPYSLPASELANDFNSHKVSEELRLGSKGPQFGWLLGAFYTYERDPTDQQVLGVNPVTASTTLVDLDSFFPSTYQEFAFFADGTYHVTSKFDIEGGVRYSENRQTYFESDYGPLGEIAPGVPFTESQTYSGSSVTFLVVPKYRFNDDLMAYARIASGYRPGGINADAQLLGLPGTFNADTTLNYELGIKGQALDRALTYDLSVYYIDWSDIQLRLINPTYQFSYFQNGGSALSAGVEATVSYHTREGLRLGANASYGDAELSNKPPSTIDAEQGSRLPYTPRFSGSLTADQDFHISDQLIGFVGATASYLGDRQGDFPSRTTYLRTKLPAFTTVDLRAGVRNDDWTVTLYLKNLTDERGVLSSIAQGVRQYATSPFLTNFTPPRVIGLTVGRSF